MSLLWVNQVMALISTESVSVISREAGMARRVHDKQHLKLTPIMDAPLWTQSVNQLDALLARMQIKSNVRLEITLASDFVRYLALPPQQMMMNAVEKMAYATAAFRENFGSAVDAWTIKLQDTPAHQTAIAVAVDQDLLSALRRIATNHHLKLSSVKPYLMTVFNGLTTQIGLSNGYFFVVEQSRLLLINLHLGHCHNVRTYALTNDWQKEIKTLMLRESLLNEHTHPSILVYAPAQKIVSLPTLDGWQVKRISLLKRILSDDSYAMLEVAL